MPVPRDGKVRKTFYAKPRAKICQKYAKFAKPSKNMPNLINSSKNDIIIKIPFGFCSVLHLK